MEFLNQTNDVILKQLRHLPIVDLLEICQTNLKIKNLCSMKDLWQYRIRDEFPEIDISQISNPRDYYLSKILYGGQIYFHYPNKGKIISEQIPYQTIVYDQLFEITRQIAEETGQPYLILYSRLEKVPHNIYLKFVPIAFQISKGDGFIPYVNNKITQVDIVLNFPDIKYNDLELLSLVQQSQPIKNTQVLQVTLSNGDQKELRNMNIKALNSLIMRELRLLAKELREIHGTNNTALYQQMVNKIFTERLSFIQNPKIPRFTDNIKHGNFQQRKQDLLTKIKTTMNPHLFQQGLANNIDNFLGFISYDDFIDFQENYINNLDEEQIATLEFFSQHMSHPHILEEKDPFVTSRDMNFLFDSQGNIVFTLPRQLLF